MSKVVLQETVQIPSQKTNKENKGSNGISPTEKYQYVMEKSIQASPP